VVSFYAWKLRIINLGKPEEKMMVRTHSTMLALGSAAPGFDLPNVSGGQVSLQDFEQKKALLVMFISKHCPFVKHILEELTRLGKDYYGSELGIVAISANDVENFPDDAPQQLKEMSEISGFKFPVCYDETQETAKAYRAACTPDFFLFDSKRKLVYRGQLDDSRPDTSIPVDGRDLRKAIEAVLNDEAVDQDQKPSLGCNIKWIAGNEPDYFG
jgi:peroxiredoxin